MSCVMCAIDPDRRRKQVFQKVLLQQDRTTFFFQIDGDWCVLEGHSQHLCELQFIFHWWPLYGQVAVWRGQRICRIIVG